MKVLSAAALGGLLVSAPVLAQPIEAVLSLKGKVPMAQLARDVSEPESPRYRQFYTPAEIRDLAAPTPAAYAQLLATLEQQGLHVVSASPSRLQLTVKADTATFARVFHARIATASDGTRTLERSARHSLSIPSELGLIATISGLDTRYHARSHVRINSQPTTLARFAGVPLATIRTLYGFDPIYASGINGVGQHIAVATYDNFYPEDVRQYYVNQNVSPLPTVDQVKFNGDPVFGGGSDVETAIDAEFSGALAPGVAVHVFTSAHNDEAGEEQMFTAILDDNRAKVANYSWGGCEPDTTPAHMAAMTTIYQRAVAQGVNVLVATGDSGAYCPAGAATVIPDFPADFPTVVAVGGTRLDYQAATLQEVAWSYDPVFGGGSGGGISGVFPLPAYQAGFPAPFIKRSYPDVAFNADPTSGQAGLVRINGGTSPAAPVVIGGTSIAAPQWAGFLALVGAARAKAGKGPVGFINPLIYGLSAGDQAVAFDGVTSGNNGAYQAGPGWNAVCGWGGLRADGLLGFLTL